MANVTSPEGVIVTSGFTPAWWCRGAHCQTLWPYLFRRSPRLAYERERVELPDGDFIDIDWCGPVSGHVVLILHGLEGCSQSHYARGLSSTLTIHQFRSAIVHFRGCSGEPNRLVRSYHSGETRDLATLVGILEARGDTPFAVVGYSLGGNVLLKWLGETGTTRVSKAVAVSVPFLLGECAARLERGMSRLYQWRLLQRMRRSVAVKFHRRNALIDVDAVAHARTLREFDDLVTAPLHGFSGSAEYYASSSCRQFLHGIRTPTLILNARDDPFITQSVLPERHELAPEVRLEISDAGGHVGFIAGKSPYRPWYWLDWRIFRYLQVDQAPIMPQA